MPSQEFSQNPPATPDLLPKRTKETAEGKGKPIPNEKKTVFHIGKTLWSRYLSGWLSSGLIHLTIFIVLATLTLPHDATQLRELFSNANKPTDELENISEKDEVDLDLDTSLPEDLLAVKDTVETTPETVSTVDDLAGAAVVVDLSKLGFEKAPKSDLMAAVGALSGQELGGRGELARRKLVARGGGNKASEAAVAAGLKWLAKHQMPDGGWSFRMDLHPRCKGKCRNPGLRFSDARTAATGLALMTFLGAGQTHKNGKYKRVVNSGLKFLVSQMNAEGSFADNSGQMYSHGIASIALCEAFAMTQDKRYFEPAQKSINYICRSQDPIGGGWRYSFQSAGDTSVVGWQLMALKSAHLGYLKVPKITIKKSIKFLDFVQADNGAFYGYTEPAIGRPSTTAVGLLCRMYLGWQPSDPGLTRGVKWISDLGPSRTDVYYNYYATQVLHHWGGDLWEKWNLVMRDQLINTQAQKDHERGSWYIYSLAHGQEDAGRLYCTCMNTMILEIYYRYLPLYKKESTTTEFIVE